MNFQLGDYVSDETDHLDISPIYQIVEFFPRSNGPPSVECYGVLDYSCNPPLLRWGGRRFMTSVEHLRHVPEMIILARVARGEHLCSKPDWIKGWKHEKD